MLNKYLEKISDMYNNMDSVLITNRDGIIEYCATFSEKDNTIKNEGYTGKYLLDVYPQLTEETSSHFRAIRFGKPIIGEKQTLTDFNGKTTSFISNTYPIETDGIIAGAIEGTVMLSENGLPANKRLRQKEHTGDSLYTIDDFITRDSQMQRLKEKVLLVAEGDSPVMIIGETGTGKEIIAQAIHTHSPRRGAPFISQNCSAIPSGLLESTLFGTVKGGYTGAENRKGLFELADKGTLFLDELNSMDMALQGKILKAVEEQKIRRVGDGKEINIDIRIVSAVNEEPGDIIDREKMRKDLYYRLGVVQLRLMQLKERKGDIPLLVKHFTELYNRKGTKKIKEFSQLAEQMLMDYDWPGNVRELRNVVEYAYNVAKSDVISVMELPDTLLYESKPKECREQNSCEWREQLRKKVPLTEIMEGYEKSIIADVLNAAVNVTDAAKQLGLSRQALNYKLMKYGLNK